MLWLACPRVGLDDRNQFDSCRDFPGRLTGLRDLIPELQRWGTRAFTDCNPWGQGTRSKSVSDREALCALVRTIEADGIFLNRY